MIIESKFEPLLLEQVEALFLAHEVRLNKFTKQTLSDSPSINYSQAHRKSLAVSSNDYSMPNKTNPESFLAFRGGSGCGGGGGHGRGGGRFANFQCQVCLKFGHTASVCHYRFDQYYQPNSTLVLHDPLSPNYSQATSTQSQKITTIIHRIVTMLAKLLVILDQLMFGLITIINLPVSILSPILVLC